MDNKYIVACELLEQNKLDDAYQTFLAIIQEDDKNYMAFNKLGVTCARQHKLEEAKDNLNSALRINPDYAPTIVNIGNLELEKGNHQCAIDYYKDAIDRDKTYHMAYYNMAVAYKSMGNLDEYFKFYKQYKQHYKQHLNNEEKAHSVILRSKALKFSGIAIAILVLFFVFR